MLPIEKLGYILLAEQSLPLHRAQVVSVVLGRPAEILIDHRVAEVGVYLFQLLAQLVDGDGHRIQPISVILLVSRRVIVIAFL